MNASIVTRVIDAANMSNKIYSALTFAKWMLTAEESAGVILRKDVATDMRTVKHPPKRNHGKIHKARFSSSSLHATTMSP